MSNTEINKFREASRMLCLHVANVAREKGITQEQIAAQTGFTQSNISRMLSGKFSPSLENFIKLANAAGVYFFVADKESDDDLVDVMKSRLGLPPVN